MPQGEEGPTKSPITREDLDALARRIDTLERLVRTQGAERTEVRCASCDRVVPGGRFCAACGAPLLRPPTPSSAPTPPPPIAPPPRAPSAAAPPAAPMYRPPPATAPPPPALTRDRPPAPTPARPARSIESMLGQRWAPRLGAVLVFLGVVFFLGVAIQRGWIGPLLQLTLATLAGGALVAAGALLTARKGYGAYPQVLEATGACVLYVTAFVAHGLPYYRRATYLTELGSGLLMATVAIATVGLALWRDARVIAALGYTLAFLTALVGQDALPDITLPYVALIGTSLAILVARKGWLPEAAAGTLATGAFMVALATRATMTGDPEPWLVAICSLVPAAAFLWLAARRAPAHMPPLGEATDVLPAAIAITSLAWVVAATLAPFDDQEAQQGGIMLVWALVAAGHVALAARQQAHKYTILASGAAAVALWLVGAPLLWADAREQDLLVAATYVAPAVALAALRSRGAAWTSAVLVGAAATWPLTRGESLQLPEGDGLASGGWAAWATLLVVATGAIAIMTGRTAAHPAPRRAAVVILGVFTGLWAFALGTSPLAVTLILLAFVILALSTANAAPPTARIRSDLTLIGAFMAAFAAAQSTLFVRHLSDASTWVEGTLILASLLAVFSLTPRPRLGLATSDKRLADAVILLALLAWPIPFWQEATRGELLASATYAVCALALAALARAGPARETIDGWSASFVLAAAAALHAITNQSLLHAPWDASRVFFGPWEAWLSLVMIGGALGILLALMPTQRTGTRDAVVLGAAAFFAIWGFALFHAPFAVTLWLTLVAAALITLASTTERGETALVAGLVVLTLVAVKVATLDMHAPAVKLELGWAIAESAIVAGALLAVFHLARSRALFPDAAAQPAAIGLVGGSAAVLVDLIVTYGEGAWTSLLLGALGVAYLATGFAMRTIALYRYTGFAVLGLVLVRVFVVDLKETDLAVRAIVFAVLGAILLGIGYAYARMSRRETTREQTPPEP